VLWFSIDCFSGTHNTQGFAVSRAPHAPCKRDFRFPILIPTWVACCRVFIGSSSPILKTICLHHSPAFILWSFSWTRAWTAALECSIELFKLPYVSCHFHLFQDSFHSVHLFSRFTYLLKMIYIEFLNWMNSVTHGQTLFTQETRGIHVTLMQKYVVGNENFHVLPSFS
jgi:hypothetical protein